MIDLSALTDEELEQHHMAVLAERERRFRLAQGPAQVAGIARQYAADGGDPATLVDAIENPPPSAALEVPSAEATPDP